MQKEKLEIILQKHALWLNDSTQGKRADLQWADLRCVDLCKANLRGADLRNADLQGTDLSLADLRGADLQGADLHYADLCGANLRGADLRWANLRWANLRGADLRKADLAYADLTNAQLDLTIEEGLLKKVAEHALKTPDALEMDTWHTCETTHCIAGWACYLAKNGEALERTFGTQIAGLKLLGIEAHKMFFADNSTAREYLQSVLRSA